MTGTKVYSHNDNNDNNNNDNDVDCTTGTWSLDDQKSESDKIVHQAPKELPELRLRRHNNHSDDVSLVNSDKKVGTPGEVLPAFGREDPADERLLLVDDQKCRHVIPQPAPCNSLVMLELRYISFAAIVVVWLLFTSLEAKVRAVMIALTFAAIEFHFRAITRPSAAELALAKAAAAPVVAVSTTAAERDMRRAMGLPEVIAEPEPVMVTPRTSRLRALSSIARSRLAPAHIQCHGHTTWEQFWANVFYGPIMNDFYRDHLFALIFPSFLSWDPIAQCCIRALLYPLNIWVHSPCHARTHARRMAC
jgi:hypothetical protein